MQGRVLAPRALPFWPPPVAAVAVVVGVVGGAGLVVASPLILFGLLGGLVVAAAMLRSLQVGLLVFVAVVSLLPFGVVPLRLGVQLTLLDATLSLILLVALLDLLRNRRPLVDSPLNLPLAAFLGLAAVSFTLGTSFAFSSDLARYFAKLVNSLLLYYTVLYSVRTRGQLEGLVRALILCGGLAALIAVLLYFMPRDTVVRLLSALRPLGYPGGPEVLRTIPGTETLRAIGTSIDPNVFGATLLLCGAFTIAGAVQRTPPLDRRLLAAIAAVVVVCLLLTRSRSSWVGLAAAWAFLALFHARRLWLLAVPAGLALLALPLGRQMLERLASGFAARDRAAALRLDEYRQAVELISTYPVLGVGFGGAPELGTFVGVSNIYLLVGEHTGLLGLTVFLAAVATVLLRAIRAHDPTRLSKDGLLAALGAAFVAALIAGLFDHYFMNPRFPHMVALFWLYAGLLVAATRLAAEARAPAPGHPTG